MARAVQRKAKVDIETLAAWQKHVTADRQRLGHDFGEWIRATQPGQAALPIPEGSQPVRLITASDIDPDEHRRDTTKFTFTTHSALLEQWWPGCSVMWDAHPTLRYWSRYELRVILNYPAEQVTKLVRVPFAGEATGAQLYGGIFQIYGQPGHAEHDRVHTPREAIKAARKMGCFMLVAYELQPPRWKRARLAVALEAGLAVTVPRRAIFNPQEDPPRWTLIT